MILENTNTKKIMLKVKEDVDEDGYIQADFKIKAKVRKEEIGKLHFILSTDTLSLGSVEDDAYLEGGTLADFRRIRKSMKVSDYLGNLKFLLEDEKTHKSDFICLNPDDVRELVKEMRVWLSDKGGEEE